MQSKNFPKCDLFIWWNMAHWGKKKNKQKTVLHALVNSACANRVMEWNAYEKG